MNQYEKIQAEIDALNEVLKGIQEIQADKSSNVIFHNVEIIEEVIKTKEHNLRMLLMQD